MSCINSSVYIPSVQRIVKEIRKDRTCPSSVSFVRQSSFSKLSAKGNAQQHQPQLRLTVSNLGHRRFGPLCAVSAKSNFDGEDEAILMNSLKEVMEQAKKRKLSLKPPIMERLFGGGNRGSSGGRGGGGGPGDSSNDGFEENWNEFLQIVKATLGFMFLYICIVRGEEIVLLVRDYIKYLNGGKSSFRLRRFVYSMYGIWKSVSSVVPGEWVGGARGVAGEIVNRVRPAMEDGMDRVVGIVHLMLDRLMQLLSGYWRGHAAHQS